LAVKSGEKVRTSASGGTGEGGWFFLFFFARTAATTLRPPVGTIEKENRKK